MDDFKSPKSNVTPAAGIKPVLRAKSQNRRKRFADLSNIRPATGNGRNDLLPRLEIIYAAVESVAEAPRRVRKHDAVQIARVKASLVEFGIVVPIIVDDDMQIVHGHAIYGAARELGLNELPVVKLSHLSKDKLRLLSVTLNRLAETGTWDDQNLKLELEELEIVGEDLSVTGFVDAEIDTLLLDDEPEDTAPEVVPATGKHAVSESGDLWSLGDHFVLNGDATKPESYEKVMQDGEQARAVVTDTPYNVPNEGHVTSQNRHSDFKMAGGEMSRDEFFVFLKAWILASAAHVIDGGIISTFIDWRSVDLVLNAGHELELALLNIIIWSKQNGGQGSFWRSQHEMFPVFKKGREPHVNNVELGRHGRWRSNVWQYPGASTLGSEAREGLADHPTVKPRAMMEDALLDMTNRDDIVIEPFLGSGSTLLAAETTGRRCRGIELDALYCDLTIRRWQELTGKDAVLVGTGERFEAVKLRRHSSPTAENSALWTVEVPGETPAHEGASSND